MTWDSPCDSTAMPEPGPLLASGRDADVFDVGGGRVLRRYRRPGHTEMEAAVMRHVRAHGYPVPEVFDAGGTDLVMERVAGPTMLDDLGAHPNRLFAHARALGGLHEQLHAIPAPGDLRPSRFGDGPAVLHLDLHPANVMLTATGPVVIDWSNASRGEAGYDVAHTWLLLRTGEVDAGGVQRLVTLFGRRVFLATFIRRFGRASIEPLLPAVIEHRFEDRNVTDRERARMRGLHAGRR